MQPRDPHVDEISEDALERDWLREKVRATPWWAMSMAFHALALSCLALITFSHQLIAQTPAAIFVGIQPKRESPIELPKDRPAGLRDQTGDEPQKDPSAEPPLKDPAAKPAQHSSTDDGDEPNTISGERDAMDTGPAPLMDPGTMFGRSLDRNAQGNQGSVGVGGNMGRLGSRRGNGRGGTALTTTTGATGPSENAVLAGLHWLARHQAADGGWHANAFAACCAPGAPCSGEGYNEFDVGETGLALLAFLGHGITHQSRDTYVDDCTHKKVRLGDVVKNGLRYLQSRQDADGCFGPRTGEFMYNHALGTLALVEAYAMTNATQLKSVAEAGLAFLSAAQNPYRGWRYTVKPGDNDTSVTGWCVMAMKSADVAGLAVPHTAYDGARSWLDSVTDESGMVGYNAPGAFDVVLRGKNDAWGSHPSMTAIGLLSRIYIEKNAASPVMTKGAAVLARDLPVWDDARHTVDFYYWYYGAFAAYQYDAPEGKLWSAWNPALLKAILPHMHTQKDGCQHGSWDPQSDRWGALGGRVYATAINVLTLEVYYRYDRILSARKPK